MNKDNNYSTITTIIAVIMATVSLVFVADILTLSKTASAVVSTSNSNNATTKPSTTTTTNSLENAVCLSEMLNHNLEQSIVQLRLINQEMGGLQNK